MGLARRQIIIAPLKKEGKKGKTSKSGSYEDQKGVGKTAVHREMEKVNTDRWLKKCKENLLTLVAPQITKSLVKREAVLPGERLPITCSFTEQVSLSFLNYSLLQFQ